MRRAILAGLMVVVALAVPSTQTGSAQAAIDPQALALDVSAFPAGAVLTRSAVDKTAAAVNAEGIRGEQDKHGNLYQALHFAGSIFQAALLPQFNGSARHLWLMATVFPTPAAAAQAYGADASFDVQCASAPTLAVSVPTQTCSYVNAQGQESGMYVVSVEQNVEFIVLGFVETASPAARDRAIRDASFLGLHEAAHVAEVLRHGSAQAVPTSSPTPPKPTATRVLSHTHAAPKNAMSRAHQSPVTLGMNGHLWQLTLTRVAVLRNVHDDYNSYNAQGKFVLVFLTAENLDKQPQNLNYDENFTLVDEQGRVFSLAQDGGGTAVNEFNLDDPSTNVQPTFTIHTAFLFDIAKDARGLTLHNAETDGSNARTLFSLGI